MIDRVCTPCGEPLEPGYSYLAGIEREGKIEFRWACDHHPIGDAAVYLASETCILKWGAEHPEYIDALRWKLLEKRESCHD
jgi:hypothetical protein